VCCGPCRRIAGGRLPGVSPWVLLLWGSVWGRCAVAVTPVRGRTVPTATVRICTRVATLLSMLWLWLWLRLWLWRLWLCRRWGGCSRSPRPTLSPARCGQLTLCLSETCFQLFQVFFRCVEFPLQLPRPHSRLLAFLSLRLQRRLELNGLPSRRRRDGAAITSMGRK